MIKWSARKLIFEIQSLQLWPIGMGTRWCSGHTVFIMRFLLWNGSLPERLWSFPAAISCGHELYGRKGPVLPDCVQIWASNSGADRWEVFHHKVILMQHGFAHGQALPYLIGDFGGRDILMNCCCILLLSVLVRRRKRHRGPQTSFGGA